MTTQTPTPEEVKELMLLAAKASGICLHARTETESFEDGNSYDETTRCLDCGNRNGMLRSWNPLTDHGDRYRLARDCKMDIDFSLGMIGAEITSIREHFTPGNDHEEGMAILRAAAAIQRSKEV